jgi:hypothetical protein
MPRNKVRAARQTARERSPATDPAEVDNRVGEVVGLRLSPAGLEYLRRVVLRDLSRQHDKITEAAPYPGQRDREFAEFFAGLERKLAILQVVADGIEAATVKL